MMICNGVRTQITHFKFLPISPLIFATVQKFALDYFRDQQILTPPCEWGWVLVVPLLGKTFEVEDSPGMVWTMRFQSLGFTVDWLRDHLNNIVWLPSGHEWSTPGCMTLGTCSSPGHHHNPPPSFECIHPKHNFWWWRVGSFDSRLFNITSNIKY